MPNVPNDYIHFALLENIQSELKLANEKFQSGGDPTSVCGGLFPRHYFELQNLMSRIHPEVLTKFERRSRQTAKTRFLTICTVNVFDIEKGKMVYTPDLNHAIVFHVHVGLTTILVDVYDPNGGNTPDPAYIWAIGPYIKKRITSPLYQYVRFRFMATQPQPFGVCAYVSINYMFEIASYGEANTFMYDYTENSVDFIKRMQQKLHSSEFEYSDIFDPVLKEPLLKRRKRDWGSVTINIKDLSWTEEHFFETNVAQHPYFTEHSKLYHNWNRKMELDAVIDHEADEPIPSEQIPPRVSVPDDTMDSVEMNLPIITFPSEQIPSVVSVPEDTMDMVELEVPFLAYANEESASGKDQHGFMLICVIKLKYK